MTFRATQLHLSVFLLLLLVGTLCSCDGSYPRELTQADSLLLRGDYQQADSLLAVYDARQKWISGSVPNFSIVPLQANHETTTYKAKSIEPGWLAGLNTIESLIIDESK